MGKFGPSRWPAATVAAVFGAAAWLFLFGHRGDFSGTEASWAVHLITFALFPLLSLGLGWVEGRHRLLPLLLFKLLIVFWSTLPDPGLDLVTWLTFAAVAADGAAGMPAWWRVGFILGVGVVYAAVRHGFSGMAAEAADPWVTAINVATLATPGALLHLIHELGTQLEEQTARNDELHDSVLELTSANTEFLEQANLASEESAASERHRITRDLHDVVGQTLTNIIMMMDASLHRKNHEPDETVKLLRWIRKQAQTGLEETRKVLYELRSIRPESIRGLKALKRLVQTFGRLSGIECRVHWGNLPWTFDPEQENAVYHLVQESLSNAFRHGAASQVDLNFHIERGVLNIMVRDNGTGGPDSSAGIGQRGMTERFARWGGTVTFRSESFGYLVSAQLPFRPAPEGEPWTRSKS